jgi:hypothetical protein
MVEDESWKQQEATIAVEGDNPGEWEYFTYPNWNEAMVAIQEAHLQGKAAVVYDGASPPLPPN